MKSERLDVAVAAINANNLLQEQAGLDVYRFALECAVSEYEEDALWECRLAVKEAQRMFDDQIQHLIRKRYAAINNYITQCGPLLERSGEIK